MGEVIVRRLEPGEWVTWREVRLAALRDAPQAFCSDLAAHERRTDAEWRAAMTLPVWVAEQGGAVVGVVRLDATGEEPELVSMWVAPTVRGGEAAARLVAAAVGHAARAGHPTVGLAVHRHNARAAALYARCGFVAVDPQPGDDPALQRMRRELPH